MRQPAPPPERPQTATDPPPVVRREARPPIWQHPLDHSTALTTTPTNYERQCPYTTSTTPTHPYWSSCITHSNLHHSIKSMILIRSLHFGDNTEEMSLAVKAALPTPPGHL